MNLDAVKVATTRSLWTVRDVNRSLGWRCSNRSRNTKAITKVLKLVSKCFTIRLTKYDALRLIDRPWKSRSLSDKSRVSS